MKTFKELVGEIEEALKRVVMFKKGKKVIKKKSDKKGYKTVGGKEVKMSAKEKIARKKGLKKTMIKMKGKKAQIGRKRKIAMKKRKAAGF
tara:strand:+ start:62 stop:331 length:270 start_codon:yes stop_codon:yes gene_type:complete